MSTTRRGALTDLEAVTALETSHDTIRWLGETGLEWHRRSFADPDQEHLLVEQDGKPVGFAVLSGLLRRDRVVEIRRVVVGDDMRGHGYGRVLINAAVERAYNQYGASKVWLDVKTTNVRARSLYESESFVATRTVPGGAIEPDGAGGDLVVMVHQAEEPGAPDAGTRDETAGADAPAGDASAGDASAGDASAGDASVRRP
ncbi:ribosomal protein S18 acetylase RimI-like enzyme [Haloactinopolyspora alba]|uniref:Ribosomal protein S18 acetylase RimI-like enzyme n=1 Tax=Haloactinopolyspora alba TaxID=648780 RepID=A0A2P8E195_9ACTN|nr:GNAT family N-acetyltransferase [Haloactinopolyspora alba]PSL03236.1 ribosomal protein S18 acetylase RimI-like enzyme [Haloactinopolyspora alba]